MLIRFSVQNLYSFDEKAEFSMVAGKTQSHKDHIGEGFRASDPRLLKSALVYGANAAGKSNLAKSMFLAQQLVLGGMRIGAELPRLPFRLRSECLAAPTTIHFELLLGDSAYSYGFSFVASHIVEEWLVRIGPASEKEVFRRKGKATETKIEFGSSFISNAKDRQYFEFLERGTRPNQLFLTEAVARNVKAPYSSVFDWFANKLTVIFPHTELNQRESLIRSDAALRSNYDEYFKAFDLGVAGVRVVETDIDALMPGMPEAMKNDLRSQLGPDKAIEMVNPATNAKIIIMKKEGGELVVLRLIILHEDEHQTSIEFDIQEESDGTQRLVDLIPALIQFQNHDKVFIIDELDRSLHPTLSRTFFEVFYHRSNSRAQLIATTHDLDLLDLELLRKDEIWFIEKDRRGSSRVYSLEEFKPRFDNDIRKGYLLGRFGAIPIVRKPQGLGW
ncbi:MAG: ATP-binding protein [Treponema sp.]|nr:ATP-binding protein [Treponema sp.]